MSFKDLLMRKSMEVLQNPKVMKLASEPRVTEALLGVLRARGRVLASVDSRVERVARSLNLATKTEVLELKRTIFQLRKELERRSEDGGPFPR